MNEDNEWIIQKTSSSWTAALSSERARGSLILTNKRLIIGDTFYSINLNEIRNIDLAGINKIIMMIKQKEEILIFHKHSTSHTIDQVASVLLATPFEAGSWQEELSSYTSYWASIITMALASYGERSELDGTISIAIEKEKEHKRKEKERPKSGAYVSAIIDGVTFKTSLGNLIRLDNVKAPEKGTPYSKIAEERLSSLILSKIVYYNEKARDNNGNIIADVVVNITSVNDAMKTYLESLTQ